VGSDDRPEAVADDNNPDLLNPARVGEEYLESRANRSSVQAVVSEERRVAPRCPASSIDST
jgi:hypothetical protein